MEDNFYYIYESHLDYGYYVSNEEEECEICEQCGDSDTLVYCGTKEDIFKELQDEITKAKNLTDEETIDRDSEIEYAESELEYVRKVIEEYEERFRK